MPKRLILSIAFGLVSAAALAQSPVEAYVSLEPPVIQWHEGAVFSIVVDASPETSVRIPSMAGKFGGVRADGPQHAVESLPDGRVRTIETYKLEPVEADLYAIEPVIVQWGEGETLLIAAPSLRVEDLSEEELAALETAAPNAELLAPRPWWATALVGGIIAAVLLALLMGLWIAWTRRRTVAVTAERPVAPWEVALARLDALAAQRLPERGQFGPYYVQLSSILRHYIEDRFGVHAPEQTTPEFLEAAEVRDFLTSEQQQLLTRFLRHMDLVKFACYIPTFVEMNECMAGVRHFVNDTARTTESQEEEAAA
jgi:hypothetical protein